MLSNSLGQQHTDAAQTSYLEAVFKNMTQRRAYMSEHLVYNTRGNVTTTGLYNLLFCFLKKVYTVLPLTATGYEH